MKIFNDMTKDFRYIVSLFALAFIMSGCEPEELYEINTYDDSAIEFSTSLATASRGTLTEDIADVAEMGVMAMYDDEYSESDKYIFVNQKMEQLTSGIWSYSPTIYWSKNSNDKYSFCIYSPYLVNDASDTGNGLTLTDAGDFDKATITYKATTTNITDQPDLLVAVCAGARSEFTTNQVDMEFEHALTAVSFTGFGLGQTVTKIKLSNIVTEGSFTLSEITKDSDGNTVVNWTLGPDTGVLELTDEDGFEVNDADGMLMINEKGYLMMIPQTFDENSTATLTVTINGDDRVTSLAGTTWGAGEDLNNNLTISLRLEDFTDVEKSTDGTSTAILSDDIWLPATTIDPDSRTTSSTYLPTTWEIVNTDDDTKSSIGDLFVNLFTALRSDNIYNKLDVDESKTITSFPDGFTDATKISTLTGHETVSINLDGMEDLSVSSWTSSYFDDDAKIPLLGEISMKNVTSIGAATFTFCQHLTTVNAPKLTDILDQQFRRCYRLETIGSETTNATTGNKELTFTRVGNFAFDYCLNFAVDTDIILDFTNDDGEDNESNVGSDDIGAHAFRYTPIVSITDKNKCVDVIGMNAFDDCQFLKTADIPNVIEIGSHAFIDCWSLTEFIAVSATTVGDYTFQNCYEVTNIELPLVVSIPEHTFFNCQKLETLDISSATFIGEYALEDCVSLVDINFSAIKRIDEHAFNGCTSLYPAIHPYPCEHPAGTIHAPVLEFLGDNAFEDCSKIEYVDMESIEEIGGYAFSRCYALKTFSAEKTETLGDGAFLDCSSLTSAYLPVVTEIPKDAFSGCASLEKVDVGASMIAIGEGAFYGCKAYESFTADNVETLGDGVFADCTKLHTVSLISMTSIPSTAFSGCTLLTSVKIPKATSVGESAFYGCEILESVSLEEVTTIGANAFENCTKLTSIGTMSKVQSIGNAAFYGTALEGDLVLENLTELPDAYDVFNGTNITSFTANKLESLGSIWNSNFKNCTSLKSFTANSLTSLGNKDSYEDDFSGCTSLTTLIVPNATVYFPSDDIMKQLEVLELGYEGSVGSSWNEYSSYSKLQTLKLDKATSVTNGAFYSDCGNYTTISLANVNAVDGSTFQGLATCDLTLGTESEEALVFGDWVFDSPSGVTLTIASPKEGSNYEISGNTLTVINNTSYTFASIIEVQ